MKESKKLRRSLITAVLALLAALLSVSAATFAWYVYNTSAHTTEVKMSAGSSISLQISNAEAGPYSSVTQMEKFTGSLVPVSTDKITGGFQKVTEFQGVWQEETYRNIPKLFAPGVQMQEFYKTTLYLRTNSDGLDIYVSDIGTKDSSKESPISTAIRLGLVVQGKEFIFEVNSAHNPNADDNGAKEPQGGYVLRHDMTDGTTVKFAPLTSDNFCEYNQSTGAVTLKKNAVSIGSISGKNGDYGDPLKVDVYLWLEGCDEDCTINLVGRAMELVSLNFAGFAGGGGGK